MPPVPSTSDMLVVAVGGDIGVYALARAFHEAYQCPAIALTSIATRAVQASSFVTNVVVPDLTDPPVMVRALRKVADDNPGRTLVLVTNADWYVEAIVANAEALREHYLMPFCSPQALEHVCSKDKFAETCAHLGMPTPTTVPVDIAALRRAGGREVVSGLDIGLEFPVIGKPASSAQYNDLHMPGKKKVDFLATRAELDDVLGRLADAGYDGTYLVQDFIPGDETHMRSLTAYRDTRGKVTLLATGRVLLQEHNPGTLGNPAAILTEPYEEAMDAATRFLDEVDYVGFANFDYKLDPRTDQFVYFEMNPRIGRNNYYVTAAGANPARAVVADLVEGRSTDTVRATGEALYCVVPFGLLLRYLDDEPLKDRLRRVRKAGRVVHPLRYLADWPLRRRYVVTGVTQMYRVKFRRYYPKATASGF
ncbi:MAG: carboxylate--amine ligase [Micrococcales bacterium]|nr:carboxylate--amine ligase [Micrococcales bacterium]MCL2667566.1 carboxylate--amine ligase [Micrococcales bacterium]